MSKDSVGARTSRPWYAVLYIPVLIAIAIGILIGHFFPTTGKAPKPLDDGSIPLIKMMIAPSIFRTVVHGISSMSDLKKAGLVAGDCARRSDPVIGLVARCRQVHENRALTNLVGNDFATVIISRWEDELDSKKLHEVMGQPVLETWETKPS